MRCKKRAISAFSPLYLTEYEQFSLLGPFGPFMAMGSLGTAYRVILRALLEL
jgi:hypothetical protein